MRQSSINDSYSPPSEVTVGEDKFISEEVGQRHIQEQKCGTVPARKRNVFYKPEFEKVRMDN